METPDKKQSPPMGKASADPMDTAVRAALSWQGINALLDNGILLDDPRLSAEIREKLMLCEKTQRGKLDEELIDELAQQRIIFRAITNQLIIPHFEAFTSSIKEIYDEVKPDDSGRNAQFIPTLASKPDLFGVSVCSVDGQRANFGDSDSPFPTQGLAATVNYGIALEQHGEEEVHRHVGKEPSGRKATLMELDRRPDTAGKAGCPGGYPFNPMVGGGGVVTTSLVSREKSRAERFEFFQDTWNKLCGGTAPRYDQMCYLQEESSSAMSRNFCLTYMCQESGGVFPKGANVKEELELYLMTQAIEVNAEALSVVAATLANGGFCPITNERVFSPKTVRNVLTIMSCCGMYDGSGWWSFHLGFPATCTMAGAMMLIIPGVCGMCIYSPRLRTRDDISQRGVQFCEALAQRERLHRFAYLPMHTTGDAHGNDKDMEVDEIEKACGFLGAGKLHDVIASDNARSIVAHADAYEKYGGHDIDFAGFQTIATDIGLSLSEERARVLFDTADHNGNGQITYDEFDHALKLLYSESSPLSPGNKDALIVPQANAEAEAAQQTMVGEFLDAASRGHASRLQQLVAKGIEVNCADYDARTALHLACSTSQPVAVDYLLSLGADLEAKDRWGNTPFDDAVREDSKDVMRGLFAFKGKQANTHPGINALMRSLLARESESTETIKKSTLLESLASAGIRANDPRFAEDLEGLPDTLAPKDVSALVSKHKLLTRALQGDLVVPDFQKFSSILSEIFDETEKDERGDNADYIPPLAEVNSDQYGVAICTIDGQMWSKGDVDVQFSVQSCTKVVSYGIALNDYGEEEVHQHVGKEASGRLFNYVGLMGDTGDDAKGHGPGSKDSPIPHNPCINAGAMMMTSMVGPDKPAAGASVEDRMATRLEYMKSYWRRLAGGRDIGYDDRVYVGESADAWTNRCLGNKMMGAGAFPAHVKTENDLRETMELYFKQCSLTEDAEAMSIIASSLANGGVCPLTGDRVFEEKHVEHILSVMSSAGMYDGSGRHAFTAGFPSKSGVGGALLIVIPNKMGICTWSPRLDPDGNSQRGVEFCRIMGDRVLTHTFDDLPGIGIGRFNPSLPGGTHLVRDVEEMLSAAAAGDAVELQRIIRSVEEYPGYLDQLMAGDYDDRTALHLAAAEGHLDAVRFLLEAGASPAKKDRWGGVPADDAKKAGHTAVADFLASQC